MVEGIELELVNLLAGGYLREVAKLGKRPEPAILASRLGIIKPNKREAYNLSDIHISRNISFPMDFKQVDLKRVLSLL